MILRAIALLLLCIGGTAQAQLFPLRGNVPSTSPPPTSQNFVMIRFVAQKSYQTWANGWAGRPNVIAGPGTAHSVIGKLDIIQTPQNNVFAGTWSLGGEDAALFTLDPSTGTLSVGASDLPAAGSSHCSGYKGVPCWVIKPVATQSGIYNSGFTDEVVIFAAGANPATVALDKTMVNDGGTITATVANAPNLHGSDCVSLLGLTGHDHDNLNAPNAGTFDIRTRLQDQPITGHGGTFTFVIPHQPIDWWRYYSVVAIPDCGSASANYLMSSQIFVPPEMPPLPPTQPAVAFEQPFVPEHTYSVCPVGCDYAKPSDAYNAAATAAQDNVLINIHGGVYQDCIVVGIGAGSSGDPGIDHLWLRGVGGSFAHIECTQGHSLAMNDKKPYRTPIGVFENMEMSDNAEGFGSAAFYPFNLERIWLRNIYVHDIGGNGVFTNVSGGCVDWWGNGMCEPRNTYTLKEENVRIARTGSGNGPQHNHYIEGNDRFDFLYSITEGASVGHALKSRAAITNIVCSKLLISYNHGSAETGMYAGASAIDFSEGFHAKLTNSIIGWGNSLGGNDTAMKWGKDTESAYGTNIDPSKDYSYEAEGNLWINDRPGGGAYPTDIGPDNWVPAWDPPYQNTPPSHSTNETFIAYGGYTRAVNPYYIETRNHLDVPQRQNNHWYNWRDIITTPDTPPGLVFTTITAGNTAATQPTGYATAVDNSIPAKPPATGTVINDGTAQFQAMKENPYFPITGLNMQPDRAAAGLPPLAGYVGYGDDPVRFPMPAACGSRPVGNVAIPN